MKYKLYKKRRAMLVLLIVLLITGVAIAGIASYSVSLNSPAAFPVDI
ncbi:MAG: hypothetical protein GDA45_04140 [Chromatiales bacterium]|nr:hypothetical protein [Chromatiales bacterium]